MSADDIWPQESDIDSQLVHEEEGTMEVEIGKIQVFTVNYLPLSGQLLNRSISTIVLTKRLPQCWRFRSERSSHGSDSGGKLRQMVGTEV